MQICQVGWLGERLNGAQRRSPGHADLLPQLQSVVRSQSDVATLDKKAISPSPALSSTLSKNMSWYEFLVRYFIFLADESTTPGCRRL